MPKESLSPFKTPAVAKMKTKASPKSTDQSFQEASPEIIEEIGALMNETINKLKINTSSEMNLLVNKLEKFEGEKSLEIKQIKEKCQILFDMAKEYREIGLLGKEYLVYEKAEKLLAKKSTKEALIEMYFNAYLKMGQCLIHTGKENAIASKLKKISSEISEESEQFAELKFLYGMLEMKKEDPQEAINNFMIALDHYLVHDNQNMIRQTYYHIGMTYFVKDDLDNSLDFLRKAENLMKNKSDPLLGSVYDQIGEIFLAKKHLDKALEFIKLGYRKNQKFDKHEDYGPTFCELAELFYEIENWEKVIECMKFANESFEHDDIQEELAINFMMMAEAYFQLENNKKCLDNLFKSMDCLIKYGCEMDSVENFSDSCKELFEKIPMEKSQVKKMERYIEKLNELFQLSEEGGNKLPDYLDYAANNEENFNQMLKSIEKFYNKPDNTLEKKLNLFKYKWIFFGMTHAVEINPDLLLDTIEFGCSNNMFGHVLSEQNIMAEYVLDPVKALTKDQKDRWKKLKTDYAL